jgi:hypothetical protein
MTSRCSTVMLSATLLLAAASTAKLFVSSDPVGATVYVDGKRVGQTPFEVKNVPAGDHRVRLTKDGYLENQRVVTVGAGRTRSVHVQLTANPVGSDGQTSSTNTGGGRKWLWLGLAAGGAAATAVILSNRNRAPTVSAVSATPATGLMAGTVITFTASASDDDGDSLTYTWDFGDGSSSSTGASATHVYTTANAFTAKVTVSDGKKDVSGTTSVTIKTLAGTWRGTLGGTAETFVFTQSSGTLGGTFSDMFGGGTLSGTVTTTPPRVRVNMTPSAFPTLIYTADPTGDVNALNGVVNGGSFVGTAMTLTRQ